MPLMSLMLPLSPMPTRRTTPRKRRGVALLLALGALLVCLSAMVTVVGLAASTKLTRTSNASADAADDLLHAAQQPILHWLSSESAGVVLSIDVSSPHVHIMHDLWSINGIEHELRITAWDQCGMAPVDLVMQGSPLRLVLSEEHLNILDEAVIPEGQVGLDVFENFSAAGHGQRHQIRRRIFPQRIGTSPRHIGEVGFTSRLPAASSAPLVIGEVIATHSSSAINVNTAPIPVVEATMRLAGRGGLDQITAARMQGIAARVAAARPNAGSPTNLQPNLQPNLHLVSASGAWAFRIDIRVDNIHRSWWAVYIRSPEGSWECGQRLVIRH